MLRKIFNLTLLNYFLITDLHMHAKTYFNHKKMSNVIESNLKNKA